MRNNFLDSFRLIEKNAILFNGQQVIFADLFSCRLCLMQWRSVGFCVNFECVFSHSKASLSNVMNSLGTPDGLHYICEKIGYSVPIGGELIGRKFTGRIIPQAIDKKERARILTRVLRLKGCEWGKNLGFDVLGRCCDTYKRCVYIHGTNLEKFIPAPLSCGCLLLNSEHLIALFDQVFVGALCFLLK